jgi:hypothetical protein
MSANQLSLNNKHTNLFRKTSLKYSKTFTCLSTKEEQLKELVGNWWGDSGYLMETGLHLKCMENFIV